MILKTLFSIKKIVLMLALEDKALMSTCVQHFLGSIKEVTIIDLEKTANFHEDCMHQVVTYKNYILKRGK